MYKILFAFELQRSCVKVFSSFHESSFTRIVGPGVASARPQSDLPSASSFRPGSNTLYCRLGNEQLGEISIPAAVVALAPVEKPRL